MIRSFVGYAREGMDKAVKDAHRDYDAFIRKHLFLEVKGLWTTSNILHRDDVTDHWFVLTVLFDGALIEVEGS